MSAHSVRLDTNVRSSTRTIVDVATEALTRLASRRRARRVRRESASKVLLFLCLSFSHFVFRYCPTTTDDVEIDCPDGSFSEANQSSCTVCRPGYECPSKVGNTEYDYINEKFMEIYKTPINFLVSGRRASWATTATEVRWSARTVRRATTVRRPLKVRSAATLATTAEPSPPTAQYAKQDSSACIHKVCLSSKRKIGSLKFRTNVEICRNEESGVSTRHLLTGRLDAVHCLQPRLSLSNGLHQSQSTGLHLRSRWLV